MRNHVLALLVTLAVALCATPPAAATDLEAYAELRAFIGRMAEKHGFSVKALERLFSGVEIRQDVIDAINRPREALPWHEYKKTSVTEYSARKGARFWRRHEKALSRAKAVYGVDPSIIVAIMGVESGYGRSVGNFRVIDALTTLMLEYPRRSEFFGKELEEFLLLTREMGKNPLELKGSYAGAMGMPQFISSSYRLYAVDFDDDKKRDILNSVEDAIGSIANFFKLHGWRANEPVVDDAEFHGTHYPWLEKLGVNTKYSISHLLSHGVFPAEVIDGERMAGLITLQSESGPVHRLAYNNFYVITRYNRSTNYAMAVHELSRLIRARLD